MTSLIETYMSLIDRAYDALAGKKARTARKHGMKTFDDKKKVTIKMITEDVLKEQLEKIRAYSVENMPDLVMQAKESMEALDATVYLAKDAKDACEYIGKVIGEGKLIVKSKTNTGREIGITKYLQEKNNTLIETDLGDRIVQLRGDNASHPVVPAVHCTKEDVAATFSKEAGREIPPEIPEIIKIARGTVREYCIKAEFGITGTNVIAAEEGMIGIVTNEGNGRLVSTLPPTHIVIAGYDKVVPNMMDATVLCRILAPYATGQLVPVYFSFIGGPSKTADVELELVLGMHGPQEMHVVLLDNGRMKALKEGYGEILRCIGCGSCLNVCPVYGLLGERWGSKYIGGIGMLWTVFIESLKRAVETGLFYCTLCGMCNNACPVGIDTPKLTKKLRALAVKEGYGLPPYEDIEKKIEETGNPFGEPKEKRFELE